MPCERGASLVRDNRIGDEFARESGPWGAMMNNTELASSIIIGGPFWRLQQRLGLLGPDGLPSVSAAIISAAVAWLPPALLSMTQGIF